MVITHEMPLEDGPKGFRMFDDKSGKDQCVKVLIDYTYARKEIVYVCSSFLEFVKACV